MDMHSDNYQGKIKRSLNNKHDRHWYDYLWLWPIIYFALGFFNILFAWLGMLDFLVPLIFAIARGNKGFCNTYCGRGRLFTFLGRDRRISSGKLAPAWLHAKWFRYGFMVFFLFMFGSVVFQTYLVAGGASTLEEAVSLLWSIRIPWHSAYPAGIAPDWVVQFSFGFYSLMLTSALIGLVVMALYRPRTWCTFCPMGTMTQGICKLKGEIKE